MQRGADKFWAVNLLFWIAGVSLIVSAAWGVDPRLGRACLGTALVWLSRPTLWHKAE